MTLEAIGVVVTPDPYAPSMILGGLGGSFVGFCGVWLVLGWVGGQTTDPKTNQTPQISPPNPRIVPPARADAAPLMTNYK